MKYFITQNKNVFIELNDGQKHNIDPTHPNYDKIIDIIKDKESDTKIKDLLDIKNSISNYYKGNIKIDDGIIRFVHRKQEHIIDNRITKTIIEYMKNDDNKYKMLVNFLNKLMKNPSRESVDSFYNFIITYKLDILDDGDVVFFKVVNSQYYSKRIGSDNKKYLNTPGKTISIPRNMVDEDRNNACSYGLHICSEGYIPSYFSNGDKIVKVTCNPRDVVSVPIDHDFSKVRVCKYKVISDVTKEIADKLNLIYIN